MRLKQSNKFPCSGEGHTPLAYAWKRRAAVLLKECEQHRIKLRVSAISHGA
jgi:hypothetical protein